MKPSSGHKRRGSAYAKAVGKGPLSREPSPYRRPMDARSEAAQVRHAGSLGFARPVRVLLPIGRAHQESVHFAKPSARLGAQRCNGRAFSVRVRREWVVKVAYAQASSHRGVHGGTGLPAKRAFVVGDFQDLHGRGITCQGRACGPQILPLAFHHGYGGGLRAMLSPLLAEWCRHQLSGYGENQEGQHVQAAGSRDGRNVRHWRCLSLDPMGVKGRVGPDGSSDAI